MTVLFYAYYTALPVAPVTGQAAPYDESDVGPFMHTWKGAQVVPVHFYALSTAASD